MTPGTVVLLHAPYSAAASWDDLPETLRSYGHDVVAPDIADSAGPRYVARASLIISATAPTAPLVLVAHGDAGPLLPAIALAQRAAHRKVGGYVFVDAALPRPEPESPVAIPPDWPEAPCGYLRSTAGDVPDQTVREAVLRNWPVTEQTPPATQAQCLTDLIAAL